jgi:dolichol-phosphate mannosyltransferase
MRCIPSDVSTDLSADGSTTTSPLFGRTFVVLLGAAVVLRFVAMFLAPLVPEEAYYWLYSQHPSLSYFDHPPVVAWVIGLGTRIFGNTEFGVRIINALLMILTSGLLYIYGCIWFGRRAALLGALALYILPVYFGVGFIATMDAALLFFWTIGLLGASYALKYGKVWGWYVAGAATGGAMLSKYTGVFLAAGLFLAIVTHGSWRKWLRSPHPWLGAMLAAGMLWPVIVWNMRHDWASFRFQFVDRYTESSWGMGHFLSFLGFQVLTLIAIFVALGIVIAARLLRPHAMASAKAAIGNNIDRLWRRLRSNPFSSPQFCMTLWFSLPLLLVTAYKALQYDIHLNWALPAYLALFPFLAQGLIGYIGRLPSLHDRQRCAGLWRGVFTGCVAANAGLMIFLLVLQPRLGWIPAFGPWHELAEIVEFHEDQVEHQTGREPLIIGEGKYRLASVLAFYRKNLEIDDDSARGTTSRWILQGEGLGFPYWFTSSEWSNSDCIYVADSAREDMVRQLGPYFESVKVVSDARLKGLGKRGFGIAVCRGFKTAAPASKVTAAAPSAGPLALSGVAPVRP